MAEELNFTVPINLDGVTPVDVTMQDPPAGAFEVEVQAARLVTNDKEGGSGKVSLRYGVMIVEDCAAKGLTTEVVCGTDYSKGFNKGHQLNMLRGLHTADGKHLPAESLKGTISITPGLVVGRRAYMFVRAPAEGEIDESGRTARANKNFITREMYEQAKKAGAALTKPHANGAARPAVTSTLASAPAPTPTPPSAGAAADLDSLFKS